MDSSQPSVQRTYPHDYRKERERIGGARAREMLILSVTRAVAVPASTKCSSSLSIISRMTNSNNFPFQLLLFTGDNYEYWSIKMKTLLLSQDLWKLVEVGYSKPAEQNPLNALTANQRTQLKEDNKDNQALFAIQSALDISILPCITGMTKSKDAWEALQTAYQGFDKVKLVTYAAARRGRMTFSRSETYVFLEPGKDEQFVMLEELKERLKGWLERWPEDLEMPVELTKFNNNLEDAVAHLVKFSCELEIGGGAGSLQWYEVHLE